jgi:pectate lyase
MMTQRFFSSLAAACLATAAPLHAADASAGAPARPARIILVGDSTMATRSGYGDALCQRLGAGTACINLARGGRSSGSFRAEGRWDEVQALLRDGAAYSASYVLIQFGHNDQPGKPGRSTDLVHEFPQNIARYVGEARALGGVPVLVTPLTRRSFKGTYLRDDLGPWAAQVRRVAHETGTLLVDLNKISAAAVQAMGSAEADTLAQAPPPDPAAAPLATAQAGAALEPQGAPKISFDRTHVGAKGAALFADMVARELQRHLPALRAKPAKPAKPGSDPPAKPGSDPGFAGFAPGFARTRLMQVAPGADYFVEARVRALPGPAGQLYLLGRHVDADNWFGAGLQVDDASPTVQVDIVRQQDGKLSRLKQVKRSIPSAGRFLTVRFEMAGEALSVYLNGEKLSSASVPGPALAGAVGIYSSGKEFELETIRVGDPAQKPMRIAPAVAGASFMAQAGDPPSRIAISAFNGDGITPARFTVRSSNPAVASAAVRGQAIVVTPKTRGSASLVVASIADPSVQTVIDATIGPAFAPPAAHGIDLAGAIFPPARADAVQTDTALRLRFDQPPRLGSAGSVRIYRQADHRLVDIIRPGDEVAAIGYPGQDQLRYTRRAPITIDGSSATIRPHANRLAYGSAYYAVIEAGVFEHATIKGQPFAGIGKGAGWSFRTRASAPSSTSLTVDDDGQADFRTVQGALNHAMRHAGRATPVTIAVANGRYDEMLFIRDKDNLTIKGESRDGVVIHNGNNDGHNPGSGSSQGPQSPSFTGGRALLMVETSDLLTLDTLTLKNTTLRADRIAGQAETIYFNNDSGRLIARNASFFSEQDTVQVKGYAWFYRSLIEGNVDFIWGANRAALFEESELRSVGDSANPSSGGYLVQARTVSASDPGFVFLNSRLTHGPGPGPLANKVPRGASYLARSPGTAATWDNVAYINCRMGEHIAPAGWAGKGVQREPAPNPARASAAGGWREFGSMDLDGKPLDLSQRVGGTILSAGEAAALASRAAVFARFDGGRGWQPEPGQAPP